MFGFACNETPKLRKNGTITWLRPDSKSQVSVVYEGNRPVRIDNVVVSHQHDDGVSYDEIINPVLGDSNLLDEKTKHLVNHTGRFVIGGPRGD
jgi:S-adenosylmethionine synthetase